ncbi:PREDICTED: zinc finger protein 862 [Buceros rhinoceros silvestris]|uniref:zinc finger protein 862 n=1 Tax=Buceros rhinoceros silvestris TaxID=175836 RepID=UPI00052904C0|nr:PREDICTED: zinc finger protein 862 [Buceros rhinoceros silvestris]
MVPPGKKPAGETSNSNKKCKRYFNEHWKEEFTWLEFDYERKLMFCIECRQALVKNKHGKAENAFTVGTDNFQRHALLRHVTSGAHRQALAVNREQLAFETRVHGHPELRSPRVHGRPDLRSVIKVEVNPAKVAVLTTVYWMAKEEIPDEKCSSLLDFQKFNLCQALLASEHSEYYHPSSVREMQAAIAKVLHNEDRHRIKASPFVGLVVDETVDVLEHRSLAMFTTTVSPCNGQTSATFLGSFELPAGEASTVAGKVGEVIPPFGIPTMKITWLPADSASLVAERLSGVGTTLTSLCPLLMEMHCLSHGSSLLPAETIVSIEYLQKYETTVDAVYRLYSSFRGESNGLQELRSVLDLCEIDLGSPKAIHWTSIFPAVEAIDSSWPTLVLLLESESERSPVAHGLCEELKKFHFVAFTKILLDVLPIFQKLSRFFQIEDFDLSILKPIVSTTATTLQAQKSASGQNLQEFLSEMNEHPRNDQEGESRLYYKGVELANCSKVHLKHFERLKESYLESVRGNLLDRFPSSVLEAISSFSAIFNPKCYPQSLEDIGSYGVSELNFLLQAYSRVVVSERALSDFPLFKRIVFSLSQLSFKDLCVKLVYSNSEMHELFPDFAVLAAIALALPLGSVLAKKISRGRELLKRGRLRCAKDEGLSDLMKIAIDGPAINEFDFALAIEYYESMRESGLIVAPVK